MNVASRAKAVLSALLVAEILRRLSLDQPIKAISRELNVSRNTVRAIDRGQFGRDKQPVQRAEYQHCHGCGGKVLMPCQLCAVRAQIAA